MKPWMWALIAAGVGILLVAGRKPLGRLTGSIRDLIVGRTSIKDRKGRVQEVLVVKALPIAIGTEHAA